MMNWINCINASILDIKAARTLHWATLTNLLDATKQNPDITAEQLTSIVRPSSEGRNKALSIIRERQKIIRLKEGEGEISYRKAVELHDKAAKIANVRHPVYSNEYILKAEEYEIKKGKANHNAWQLESQAKKYWDYVISFSEKKDKSSEGWRRSLNYFGDFFPMKEEAFLNYREAIEYLREAIKYRRKELLRINKML